VLTINPLMDEINDRCNADLVLKIFTCSQAAWLLVQTFVRLTEGKAVSELEITTCGYILCTVVAYACWLQKPYSVGGRVIIRDKFIVPREEYTPLQQSLPAPQSHSYSTLRTLESTPPLIPLTRIGGPMLSPKKPESAPTHLPIIIFPGARFTPFNRSYLRPDASWSLGYVAGLLGTIVGLIHGIPLWNALFVTTTGQWLWRASCIAQAIIPIALIATIAVVENWHSGVFLFLAVLLMVFLYCVSRMILFALIGISFWSLPASVYVDVDWAWAYLPHWH